MSLITIDRSLIGSDTENEDCLADMDKLDSSSRSSQSEDFMMCKGTAMGLNIRSRRRSSCIKPNDEIQDHLKRIIALLRFGDYIQLIVRLQCLHPRPHQHRYCCIISTNGKQETEESAVLGIDITDGRVTIGLVLPVFQDMSINLCGDGGFELVTKDGIKQFKPVSVQALWAAFQAVNKTCQVARTNAYFSRGFTHDWINYYHGLPASNTYQIQEWLKTDDIDSFNEALPPTTLSENASDEEKERVRMEALIRVKLQEIMFTVDLEEVTVLELRERLEAELNQTLHNYKQFIDKQILTIYGQMDEASVIFDHVLLGTTFNASNRNELERRSVTHILNVTREVDNFFPGDKFEYKNIRVYDDEQSSLLPFWEETHRFINEAKNQGTRCLVHCKMGISRSASTVIAYAMKEYNWDLETAFGHVKCCRACVQPNPGFMKELLTYQGILEASSNRHKPIFCKGIRKPPNFPCLMSINTTNQQLTCDLNEQSYKDLDECRNSLNQSIAITSPSSFPSTTPVNSSITPINEVANFSQCIQANENQMNTNLQNLSKKPDLELELFKFKQFHTPTESDSSEKNSSSNKSFVKSDYIDLNLKEENRQKSSQQLIVYNLDDIVDGVNCQGENTTILAKDFQYLLQWHPDIVENISINIDCKISTRKSFSTSSTLSSKTQLANANQSESLSHQFTSNSHGHSHFHSSVYHKAELSFTFPILWDRVTDMNSLDNLMVKPNIIIIPTNNLITSCSIHKIYKALNHLKSNTVENIDPNGDDPNHSKESNGDNDSNNEQLNNVNDEMQLKFNESMNQSENSLQNESNLIENTKSTSNVLRIASKLSDSNLFNSTLNSPNSSHPIRSFKLKDESKLIDTQTMNQLTLDTETDLITKRKSCCSGLENLIKISLPERSHSTRSSCRKSVSNSFVCSRLRPDNSWIVNNNVNTNSDLKSKIKSSNLRPISALPNIVLTKRDSPNPDCVQSDILFTLDDQQNHHQQQQQQIPLSSTISPKQSNDENKYKQVGEENNFSLSSSSSSTSSILPLCNSARDFNQTTSSVIQTDPQMNNVEQPTSYLEFNRPVRRFFNWPPSSIDPMATESYCL